LQFRHFGYIGYKRRFGYLEADSNYSCDFLTALDVLQQLLGIFVADVRIFVSQPEFPQIFRAPVPDYILRADENNKGQPKYTEPGSWTVTPTYEWGTVTLDLFPDDDISFKKPTPSRFLFVLISLLVVGYGALQCFVPRQLAKLHSRLRRNASTSRIERDSFFDRFAGFVLVGAGAYILLATLAL
jgi:hypothetical protein